MSLESEFSGAVRCRGLINKVRAAWKHFFEIGTFRQLNYHTYFLSSMCHCDIKYLASNYFVSETQVSNYF